MYSPNLIIEDIMMVIVTRPSFKEVELGLRWISQKSFKRLYSLCLILKLKDD